MASAVLPGVWWLHGTRGCNVYLVDSEGALVLIDTGFGASAAAIVREVEAIAPGRRPSHVLLTHAHPDHAGAAAQLRELLGAALVAGRGDCERCEDGTLVLRSARMRVRGPVALLRRSLQQSRGRGRPRGAAPPRPVTIDVALEGECEVVAGVRAVPVPGHTPGSYCYVLEERGIAFVGDLVISHDDGLARSAPLANADDAEYLRSLATFAVRAPERAGPGHGAPVLVGFGAQLRELAAMPRRSVGSPGLLLQRLRRMRAFARSISHVRRSEDSR